MIDRAEIAWAAGLFEGEGCFTLATNGKRKQRYSEAVLSMTDEDVVRRFAASVGLGTVGGPRSMLSYGPNCKDQWRWRTHGFENTQALVAMFWPWLGSRRRQRAQEVLRLHASVYPDPREQEE